LVTLRQAAINQLRARVIRRHGRDNLPISINRRRIYILPTRFGFMLGAILGAMLVAGLNYNSNLALAFAFLMSSMALVTMHHCNRNMLRLSVDATTEVDAFAGREALLELVQNTYMNWVLDREQRAKEFDALCRLIQRVPVRRILPHAKPERMPALCELILKDARAILASPAIP